MSGNSLKLPNFLSADADLTASVAGSMPSHPLAYSTIGFADTSSDLASQVHMGANAVSSFQGGRPYQSHTGIGQESALPGTQQVVLSRRRAFSL